MVNHEAAGHKRNFPSFRQFCTVCPYRFLTRNYICMLIAKPTAADCELRMKVSEKKARLNILRTRIWNLSEWNTSSTVVVEGLRRGNSVILRKNCLSFELNFTVHKSFMAEVWVDYSGRTCVRQHDSESTVSYSCNICIKISSKVGTPAMCSNIFLLLLRREN